jgi:hypothetical protein
MILKIYAKDVGRHTNLRMFMGEQLHALASCGHLVMLQNEASVFLSSLKTAMFRGSPLTVVIKEETLSSASLKRRWMVKHGGISLRAIDKNMHERMIRIEEESD